MSITPVSGLKVTGAGCEKGLPDPCAQDIPKHCGDTVGGLRGVQGSEMEPDSTCGEIVHLFVISVNPQNVKPGSVTTQ